VFTRPSVRGRPRRERTWVVALGLTTSLMSITSYAAMHRIPQGTATALERLGPLALPLAVSRSV
jgi:inner membrane transporter RhtA